MNPKKDMPALGEGAYRKELELTTEEWQECYVQTPTGRAISVSRFLAICERKRLDGSRIRTKIN